MEIKKLKVKELQNWDDNPREIAPAMFEKLIAFISKYGLISPLLIDGGDMRTVLGGNMRLKALKQLGWSEVECTIVYPQTQAERIEIALVDNANFGTYVAEKLHELIKGVEVDLSIPIDIKPIELGKFEAQTVDISGGEKEEDAENFEVFTKPGDIYELDGHRLICGDSTDSKVIKALMNGKKAEVLLTDPPYNVDYTGTAGKIQNDKFESNSDFEDFLSGFLINVKDHVKGDCYIFMSSSELHTLYNAFTKCGGYWSTYLIWVKNTFTLGRSNYQRQYEPILYGWFKGSNHWFSGVRDQGDVLKDYIRTDPDGTKWMRIDEDKTVLDVLEEDKPMRNKEHPTMKPIPLIKRLISNSCKINHIVLDVFGGSGSTLIASEEIGRLAYLIELDPKFCDVIVRRFIRYKMEAREEFKIKKNGIKFDYQFILDESKDDNRKPS